MEVVFVLLPLALIVAGVMLALFIWAVRAGQFDDLETPAVRVLFDEKPKPSPLAQPLAESPEQLDSPIRSERK